MLKYLLLFMVFFTQVTFAQTKLVVGDGKFNAKETDALDFVKKQLIHEALLDIVTKELKEIGLNDELFWQKYNDGFETTIKSAQESLKTRFGIGTDKENAKSLEQYNDSLRFKKLNTRIKYANLHRVLSSYSIKRMSRAPQNPSLRFIKLEAKVDRSLLSKIYFQFVQGKKSSEYGSLFINTEYELINCSYSDLGVENEKDFTSVLNKHWLDWFNNNRPENIANIEILDEDKKAKLKEFQSLPIEKSFDSIPDIFINSLLISIKVKVDLQEYSKVLKEHEFQYSGDIFLQDLQTGKIISQGSIPIDIQKYSNVADNNLSSVIANYVYRMPLALFTKFRTKMANIPPLKLSKTLTLFNYKNLKDVDDFIELIQEKGIKYSLSSKLISIGVNKATLLVYFDGEISEFKELLDSVESAKKDLPFEFIDSEDALGIKFNQATVTKDV